MSALWAKFIYKFIIVLQGGNDQANSYIPTFSALASSYTLPDNVALITLQVTNLILCLFDQLYKVCFEIVFAVLPDILVKDLYVSAWHCHLKNANDGTKNISLLC